MSSNLGAMQASRMAILEKMQILVEVHALKTGLTERMARNELRYDCPSYLKLLTKLQTLVIEL